MRGRDKQPKTALWEPNDRSALMRAGGTVQPIEKLISVPLDPDKPKIGQFDLYYFVYPPRVASNGKTVLFCSGGPGQIIRPNTLETTHADFLTDNGYNVLHFHLRGCGFSQLPPSVLFDKYLRTRFAVKDIEAIRRDFLGENGSWDAIIARSYGTLLAQRYARCHVERVNKLILIAPLSRHMFNSSGDAAGADAAFDALSADVIKIHRQSLKSIFNSPEKKLQGEFGDLRNDEENELLDAVFANSDEPEQKGIFARAEDAFGSIQFIVDAYDDLQKKGLLSKYKLDGFSRDFFRCLRDLRLVGSMTGTGSGLEDRQLTIGKTMVQEVLRRETEKGSHNEMAARQSSSELQQHMQDSHRVFYNMSVLDGLNPRFLKDFRSGEKDILQSLQAIGGDAHIRTKEPVNKWLAMISIDDSAKIKPWDPAKYYHSVPTLILKGGADPVTAAGQAEHVFDNALIGYRTLIEFQNAGHEISLPAAGEEECKPILSGVIRMPPCRIPAGETLAIKASANGRYLNKELRIELTPTIRLQPGLRCVGYGVPVEENVKQSGEPIAEGDFLLLIENNGNQRSKPADTRWNIGCSFFTGEVWVRLPPIPPKTAKLVSGKVTYGTKNVDNELELTKSRDLEPDLGLFGYKFRPPDRLAIWIKNSGEEKIDGKTRTWTVKIKNQVVGKFKFNSPEIEPGKIASSNSIIVDGLRLHSAGELVLEAKNDAEDLEACIPPLKKEKISDGKIPVRILNAGLKAIRARFGTWTAENVAFRAELNIEHGRIPPGEGVEGHAKIKKVVWNEWLKINSSPADLEQGIVLLGFNILGPNEILLLIKNTSVNAIEIGPREWVYSDPNDKDTTGEEIKSACLNCGNVLNCLIYSFLIMDSQGFISEADNRILGVIQRMFQQKSQAVTIRNSVGDRREK
jgi:pimeloyl-ACP methyl ester carboxylesterase